MIESDYDDREAFEEANGSRTAEWEDKNGLSGYEKLWDIFNHFKDEYGVGDEYSDEEALDIIAVRYEMEQRSFSATNPFTIANDVSDVVVQKIKESYSAAGECGRCDGDDKNVFRGDDRRPYPGADRDHIPRRIRTAKGSGLWNERYNR